MRLKGLHRLIDWEMPCPGPQIADICFWHFRIISYLMPHVIVETHWSRDHLSEHLFRCLNSNDSPSLVIINHMLYVVTSCFGGNALFTASSLCIKFLLIFFLVFFLVLIPINHMLLQASFLRWHCPFHSINLRPFP